VTLTATEDGTVASAGCCAGLALGDHDVLTIGSEGDGTEYRSYVLFDPSPLTGAMVAHAELRLTARRVFAMGEEVLPLFVFAAARPWTQGGLDWRRQPGADGAPFATAALRPEHAREVLLDVTRLVAAWVSGAAPNRGVVVVAQRSRPPRRVSFYSSEAARRGVRPVIEVEVQ
jgi:hypothetical protein